MVFSISTLPSKSTPGGIRKRKQENQPPALGDFEESRSSHDEEMRRSSELLASISIEYKF
jgi:hypothetical protein